MLKLSNIMISVTEDIPIIRVRGHEVFIDLQQVDEDGEQIDITRNFEVPGFEVQEHDLVMDMLMMNY